MPETPPLTAADPTAVPTPGRLWSLDALRGFVMFWIVGGEGVVAALRKVTDVGPVRLLADQMDHKPWAGFAFYDLIFPMFVFVVGVSLVFSLTRLIEREGRATALRRVFWRALVMYVLGLLYYGGFSGTYDHIRLLGVLQRIALAYFFAGVAFCYLKPRGLVLLGIGLLVAYWAALTFVPVPGVGPGVFDEGKNLTNWFDSQYLPLRRWDGDHDPEGILSTVPAVATCLIGVLAGYWIRRTDRSDWIKVGGLLVAGVALATAGWLWHLQFPVIKKLWTSSFVLVAGGYSCLFLALFHFVIESLGWRTWAMPFVWIGMNPITLYLLHNILDFEKLATRFVGGEFGRQVFGVAEPLAVNLVAVAFTLLIARWLYRRKLFLRL